MKAVCKRPLAVTSRARTRGAKLALDYESSGRHTRFSIPIAGGQVKIRRKLPRTQPKDTGIVTLRYAGNAIVAPDEVRVRAADGKARLVRRTAAIEAGRLVVGGTIARAARGVVRIRLGFDRADGSTGFLYWNARIARGRWSVARPLPGEAARGGQLSIQFTGYERRNLRGEQTAKQVLAG